MENAIKDFGKQFNFIPEIINKEKIGQHSQVVVLGMGGSHLAADILKDVDSSINIIVHNDYGLPKNLSKDSLIVASSYSGNTEEVIHGLEEALSKGLNIVVVGTGGKAIEIAKERSLPFVQIPNTGIQPRSALGFSLTALAHLIGSQKTIEQIEEIKYSTEPESFRESGKNLAEKIDGKIPLIYASCENFSIAYNWKIKLNETAKIPAFYNLFPELNHNEMVGFDFNQGTQKLVSSFIIIFQKDKEDFPKIQNRMDVTKKMYEQRGVDVLEIEIFGKNKLGRIINSLILADWVSYYTALKNNVDPEVVSMVEDFKKQIG